MLDKERLLIASPVFKLLLCRSDEASNASRLGNNELKPMKQLSLNSVTKNITPEYLNQPNLIKQRTAADVGMVLDLLGTKKSRALMLMFNLDC